MKNVVIKASNLGKRYHITGSRASYQTLRESVMNAATAPFRAVASAVRRQNDDSTKESRETVWAVKNVSFEVRQGDVVGIIGRNGAGKTTLLRIMSRITEPTEGYAEIRGRVGSLLEVGSGFHPELTGRENIYLNGAVLGMRKTEINRKFGDIVEFSGVEKFIDTPLKYYSSGMQVRLAFAVAAHLEPEILMVDEVLAVGDAEFQKKCLGKMGEVARGGRTVLFVSHNMFSLQNLCTKGILLDSGQVSMQDNINAVINRYLEMGKQQTGEVCWSSPDTAPGDVRARIKAVRIVSNGQSTGEVDIDREFSIEVDYWNLQPDSRRVVSVHLYNSMGICVFASANLPEASTVPDPWYSRPYPAGLFRTSCGVPGNFLNDGLHSVSVFLNERVDRDIIILLRDALSFVVRDTDTARREYTGVWRGVVRPHLNWHTTQLN